MKMLWRPLFCAMLPLLARCMWAAEPEYWPTHGWRESPPERQGVDSDRLSVLFRAVKDHEIPVHSILLIRHGYVILDAVFYPYERSIPHDIASCTKSITASLVGMAIGSNQIGSVRDRVSRYGLHPRLPDEGWSQMTVEDLLTMRSGIGAEGQSGEPREMRASPDWLQFVVDQPLRSSPGTTFLYSSSAMHALAAVLRAGTHQSPLEFARVNLFQPLGIETAVWPADPSGLNHGWGDLHLFPRDMAKIGLLFLRHGRWEDRQILPAEFARAATRLQAKTGSDADYGYGWWVFGNDRAGDFEAVGRGGQRISVLPRLDMIVVTTGGGFEPGALGSILSEAVRSDDPLAENPRALAGLRELSRRAETKPETSEPPPVITEVQQKFSGEYRVAPNPYALTAIAFDFSVRPALLELHLAGGKVRRHAIAFGRIPLMSPGGIAGLPVAVRANWTGTNHLTLLYDEVASINCLTVDVVFSKDGAQFSVTDRTDATSRALFGGSKQ